MKLRFLIAGLAAVLVVGCGGGTSGDGSSNPALGSGSNKSSLEVEAFQGGYGIDFFEKAAKEFGDKNHIDVKVSGSPRIWEQLQPRFVSGDVPDLTWPGWGIDYWSLVYDGQLMDLSKALDGKPYSGEGTWRDTFEPSLLKLGEYEGKQYMMPYHFNVMGWWYDPGVFTKNGWAPPKTFEDLLSLCDKIKAKGIAPITFQGKYPYYMIDGFLIPWIVSAGGIQALDDAQSLKPGAWKSSAVLNAAQMIATLRDAGDFQKGATGLDHTQSQTEFLNGRAAMIPCGSWLFSEMKQVMPKGAQMEFMLPPVLANGTGDKSAIGIGIEPWVVPAKAKNPDKAIELYKYMTSLEKAKQFVEEKGTLMAIKGSDQAKIPPHLQGPAAAFKASKAVWSAEYRQWYKAFNTELEGAMTSLLNGEITPQQFCDRVETKAEEVRNDKSIPKHVYVR